MRISCEWQPGGALSFRNRSSKIWGEYGRNMQNISPEEKKFFLADEGKVILQRDIAGAEAVIVGYLCRPGPYRDLAKFGVKHHSYIAGHIFKEYWKKTTPYDVDHLLKLSVKELSEHPHYKPLWKIIKSTDDLKGKERRYYLGKKVGLSFNYSQGADSFRYVVLKETEGQIVLSKLEAEMFKGMYETIFPEIPEWQKRVEEEVNKYKLIRNLFDFPFRITSHIDAGLIRKAIAWKAQSTIGVLAAKAMVKMQLWSEDHPLTGCDILGNVHDSVFLQCYPEALDEVDEALKSSLDWEFESPYDGESFRLKTEASVGKNLAKFDADENPEGLVERK